MKSYTISGPKLGTITAPSGRKIVRGLTEASTFTLTCVDRDYRRTQQQATVEIDTTEPDPGDGPNPPRLLSEQGGPLSAARDMDPAAHGSVAPSVEAPSPTSASPSPSTRTEGGETLRFCDGYIGCEQLTKALQDHAPFAGVDLPGAPDPQTMVESVCVAIEEWLDREDDGAQPPVHPPEFVHEVRELLLPELDPNKTVLARARQRLRLRGELVSRFAEGYLGDPLDRLLWAPHFSQPMYEPLRDLSHELLLPGVERIRQNTIGLLKTNRRFLESYMCGLNHAFSEELLWRGYPTDLRGSYFRQFWDVSEYAPRETELDELFRQWLRAVGVDSIRDVPLAIKERVLRRHLDQETQPIEEMPENERDEWVESLVKQELLAERLRDIKPLVAWGESPLGTHQNRPTEDLVLVVRGDLLKRYPSALVFAVDGDTSNDDPVPALAEYTATPQPRILPTFRVTLPPDLTFFGFPFDETAARGGGDDPGKYFVIEQRVTETRFGLDAPAEAPAQPVKGGGLTSWDDLSWSSFEMGEEGAAGGYLDDAPDTAPAFSFTDEDGRSWHKDTSSATRAWITLQKPVRIALHAKQLMPEAMD